MNIKSLFSLLFMVGCTSAPNGAISYNSIRYYIDDKFHDEIPEDYIFKTWGYRKADPFGREHTYRDSIEHLSNTYRASIDHLSNISRTSTNIH